MRFPGMAAPSGPNLLPSAGPSAGTAAHLERIVRAYRRALGTDETDQAKHLHRQRFLERRYDDDGSVVVRARLAPEAGDAVAKAVELAMTALEESSAEDSSTGNGTLAQRRADALVVMAESFVANGPAALRGGDRHLVTVHVGAEALAGDGPGRCEIDGGPSLAAETARRLSCDASLVGIVEDGDGNPLEWGARCARSLRPSAGPSPLATGACAGIALQTL